ncbi:hypothetical protein RhiirA5_407714 [Rhizophagus irregularis]|uniref:Uncharacterized protein n=1 Tax=Rhizophagus irregularis TaxID=588596 RepID=A0A2N0Q9V7_9GLOM|nr:hypothetical protein RhiirA5_407714 [Rhizophagus irregularis]
MPLLPDSCDHCRKKLDDGEVLICGYSYHFKYYQMIEYGCHYCDEYYKCKIYNKTSIEENETVEEVEINGSQEVHAELLIALIHVNTW